MSLLNTPADLPWMERSIADVLHDYGALRVAPASVRGAGIDLVVVPTSAGEATLSIQVMSRASRWTENPTHASRADLRAYDHVNEAFADRLRESGIAYVDATGNAWIDLPGFRVDVRGRKAPVREPERLGAFGFATSRLVFTLLSDPTALDLSVRQLARASGVADGTASGSLHKLEQQGYIESTKARRTLRRSAELLRLWLASYESRLSPRLETVRLTGPDPEWWLGHRLPDASVSGGAALTAMGYPISSTSTIVYGAPPWGEIRKGARLERLTEWNVQLRERFWEPMVGRGEGGLCPPLLVYADAKLSGDPRVEDMADEMWENDGDLRRLRERA